MPDDSLLEGHGNAPGTVRELDDVLSAPDDALVEDLTAVQGDIVIIGAGGKMGPTLARMAKQGALRAGSARRVIAVSRFAGTDNSQRQLLDDAGVETLAIDLLDAGSLERLPEAPNVVYMLGRKFGTMGAEPLTWAVNTYLPGAIAARYQGARVVAFSTGNVYPFMPVRQGAPDETHQVAPVGEYAQSCLGRERVFADAAQRLGARVLLFRLNYAIELRYGVLAEVGSAVWEGRPVDLTTGHVNVIWQRDANSYALRALRHCDSPAAVLNASGPETASVRWLADQFAARFEREPVFTGEEGNSALLTNAGRAHAAFGYPRVPLLRALEWTAQWIRAGGERLAKPTHFQEQRGQF